MSIKKSSQADLESKRPLFFLIGLNLVLIIVISVFQWKTEARSTFTALPAEPEATIDVVIPRTIQQPHKPEIKYRNKADEINPVEDIPLEKPKLNTSQTIGAADSVVEPIEEFIFDERPEQIPAMLVQKLAVPPKCADLNDREKQLKCLNKWLRKYIHDNMNMAKLRHPMLDRVSSKVHFVVSEHGMIEDVTIVQGDYEPLNEEVIRLLEDMPAFRPATQMGKRVRMSMAIPVNVNFR